MRYLLTLALLVVLATMVTMTNARPAESISNRIIFIRHGEKGFQPEVTDRSPPPPPGRGGGKRRKFPSGLNDQGRQRAQYLATLFGNSTDYSIGKIFAAPWDLATKETERTYATALPLAQYLGLEIDVTCARAEFDCVADRVYEFAETSADDILIVWKHWDINLIAQELGAINARIHYPDERYDIIWIMQGDRIVEKRSEHCPKLDDDRVDEGDPDLIVEEPSTTLQAFIDSAHRLWRQTVTFF